MAISGKPKKITGSGPRWHCFSDCFSDQVARAANTSNTKPPCMDPMFHLQSGRRPHEAPMTRVVAPPRPVAAEGTGGPSASPPNSMAGLSHLQGLLPRLYPDTPWLRSQVVGGTHTEAALPDMLPPVAWAVALWCGEFCSGGPRLGWGRGLHAALPPSSAAPG